MNYTLFIKNNFEYTKIMNIIKHCFYIEKELPNNVFKNEYKKFLYEDFDLILDEKFLENLKILSKLSKDKYVILGILDKKNQSFYEHFGCFNVIKIPIDITNKEFEEIIDFEPQKEYQSVRYCYNKIIYLSQSEDWIIYCDREFEISILALKNNYDIEHLKTLLPRWISIEETIETYLSPMFTVMPKFLKSLNMSKTDLKKTLIKNYTNLL